MKLSINYGLVELEIPWRSSFTDLLEVGGTRVVDHAKRQRDLSNNCLALQYLLELVPELQEGSVTDYFAGIGMWAAVVLEVLSPSSIWLYDYDKSCIEHLKRLYTERAEVKVKRRNSYVALKQPTARDLSLLDFTKCTWKSVPLRLIENIGRTNYVVLSDCAGAKIHLNYRTYNLSKSSYKDYITHYVKYLEGKLGWTCLGAVSCGGNLRPNSGYLLFGPGKKSKLEIAHYNAPEALVVQ